MHTHTHTQKYVYYIYSKNIIENSKSFFKLNIFCSKLATVNPMYRNIKALLKKLISQENVLLK